MSKKPPITVNIPPKKTTKHKPTQAELQHRFVQYWTAHGYANLQSNWDDIRRIAKSTKLDAVYVAAYLMTRKAVNSDYQSKLKIVAAESARLGKNKGGDTRVKKIVDSTPNFKRYDIGVGSWGGSAVNTAGQTATTKSLTNPTVVTDRYGRPVDRNSFQQEWASVNDLFTKYLGRKATKHEIITIVKNAWSQYKIETYLTKKPGFFKGDVWKSEAPTLKAAWEAVYGVDKNLKPPKELMRQAILRGGGGSAWFQDAIRKLPQYKQSTEYQGLYQQYSQLYYGIYGYSDENGKKMIDNAIMHRTTPEAFQQQLRTSPNFVHSWYAQQAFQSANEFGGMIFGQQPQQQEVPSG